MRLLSTCSFVLLGLVSASSCGDQQSVEPPARSAARAAPLVRAVTSSAGTVTVSIDTSRALRLVIGDGGSSRIRAIGTHEFTPQERVAAAAQGGADPARWTESQKRWLYSVSQGPAPVAVVAGPLVGGAIAQVVRDPHAARPRLIVLPANTSNDRPLADADEALTLSEVRTPHVAERMVITLWGDGRYHVQVGDSGVTGIIHTTYFGEPRTDFVPEVLAGAARSPVVDVSGVGPARLYQRQR